VHVSESPDPGNISPNRTVVFEELYLDEDGDGGWMGMQRDHLLSILLPFSCDGLLLCVFGCHAARLPDSSSVKERSSSMQVRAQPPRASASASASASFQLHATAVAS